MYRDDWNSLLDGPWEDDPPEDESPPDGPDHEYDDIDRDVYIDAETIGG